MIDTNFELSGLEDEIKTLREIKITLMSIINKKSTPEENKYLAQVALEEIRTHERECLAEKVRIKANGSPG
jgi:predicted outer membrane protein